MNLIGITFHISPVWHIKPVPSAGGGSGHNSGKHTKKSTDVTFIIILRKVLDAPGALFGTVNFINRGIICNYKGRYAFKQFSQNNFSKQSLIKLLTNQTDFKLIAFVIHSVIVCYFNKQKTNVLLLFLFQLYSSFLKSDGLLPLQLILFLLGYLTAALA